MRRWALQGRARHPDRTYADRLRPRWSDPLVRLHRAVERYRLEGSVPCVRHYPGGPMTFSPSRRATWTTW